MHVILIIIDCGFQLLEEMAAGREEQMEEQIKQFCELTGEAEDCAKFFLEASGWGRSS